MLRWCFGIVLGSHDAFFLFLERENSSDHWLWQCNKEETFGSQTATEDYCCHLANTTLATTVFHTKDVALSFFFIRTTLDALSQLKEI